MSSFRLSHGRPTDYVYLSDEYKRTINKTVVVVVVVVVAAAAAAAAAAAIISG